MGADERHTGTRVPETPGSDVGSAHRARLAPACRSRSPGSIPFTTYHYRVVADRVAPTPATARTSYSRPRPGVPTIGAQNGQRRPLRSRGDARGDQPEGRRHGLSLRVRRRCELPGKRVRRCDESPGPADGIGMGKDPLAVSVTSTTSRPGRCTTTVLVGSNSIGTGVPSVDRTFRTYPSGFDDKCPNAHVRQQTGAALLLDCRAYELASAVQRRGATTSSRTSFPARRRSAATRSRSAPRSCSTASTPAASRGPAIRPTTVSTPTSRPAARTVGRPSTSGFRRTTPSRAAPFASSLLEADASLDTFAFGGPEICSPCFADGSTGARFACPTAALSRVWPGALDPGPGRSRPATSAASLRRRQPLRLRLHLPVRARWELQRRRLDLRPRPSGRRDRRWSRRPPGGTDDDRRPESASSTSRATAVRILFGQLGTDSAGNRYWHLYMSVGGPTRRSTSRRAPTGGALYDGMTRGRHEGLLRPPPTS